jgi:hypothetical protein
MRKLTFSSLAVAFVLSTALIMDSSKAVNTKSCSDGPFSNS